MKQQRTITNIVARSVINKTGHGTTIFNDRLVDGRRSLKVWGWSLGDYYLAKSGLESLGCSVKVRQFATRQTGRLRRQQTRLHVTE